MTNDSYPPPKADEKKHRYMSEFDDKTLVRDLLGSGTAHDKARQKFSAWSAKIEQAGQQRTPLSAIEMRRMEFEAVRDIVAAFGINLSYGQGGKMKTSTRKSLRRVRT